MNEIDKLAGIAESLAETAEKLVALYNISEHWFQFSLITREEGYKAGLADARPRAADEKAREARKGFQVVPGGKTARRGGSETPER